MDALFELLAPLVLHWRVGVVTLGALLVAFFLTAAFALFTGVFGIAVVLLGFGVGMLWEADASRSKARASPKAD
jgi:hypothetical protein